MKILKKYLKDRTVISSISIAKIYVEELLSWGKTGALLYILALFIQARYVRNLSVHQWIIDSENVLQIESGILYFLTMQRH